MEYVKNGTRRVPVMATVIALFTGLGSILTLLTMFHLNSTQRDGQMVLQQQSILYKTFYAVTHLCSLAGAILLWKMNTLSGKFYTSVFVCSIIATFLFHPADGSRTTNIPLHIGGFCLSAAIAGYAWWVTARWQATRPMSTEPPPR